MHMKILLATPLYPPQIGGPAQYAFHLEEEFQKMGHQVSIATFTFERNLPSFIRHLFFFFKILPAVIWSNRVIVLDASSVGVPTIAACAVFCRRAVVRIGGDFLWESYIERTGAEISLPDFYQSMPILSLKEKIIKSMSGFVFCHAFRIVVNSEWFSDIIAHSYGISLERFVCIENHFSGVSLSDSVDVKRFIAAGRQIKLKNIDRFSRAVIDLHEKIQDIELITTPMSREVFLTALKSSYVVAVPSFSDVSPNVILDGLALGKPFIVTKYTGLHKRFADMGLPIDPFSQESIDHAIMEICNPSVYNRLRANIAQCSYVHTWPEIAYSFEQLLLL